MVLCRLYEQVYHSFVVTEQERGLKDPRQPTEIIIQTELVASCCKAYNEYRLHVSYGKDVEGWWMLMNLNFPEWTSFMQKRITRRHASAVYRCLSFHERLNRDKYYHVPVDVHVSLLINLGNTWPLTRIAKSLSDLGSFPFPHPSSGCCRATLTFNPPTLESLAEELDDDILPIRVGDIDLSECMSTLLCSSLIY